MKRYFEIKSMSKFNKKLTKRTAPEFLELFLEGKDEKILSLKEEFYTETKSEVFNCTEEDLNNLHKWASRKVAFTEKWREEMDDTNIPIWVYKVDKLEHMNTSNFYTKDFMKLQDKIILLFGDCLISHIPGAQWDYSKRPGYMSYNLPIVRTPKNEEIFFLDTVGSKIKHFYENDSIKLKLGEYYKKLLTQYNS